MALLDHSANELKFRFRFLKSNLIGVPFLKKSIVANFGRVKPKKNKFEKGKILPFFKWSGGT